VVIYRFYIYAEGDNITTDSCSEARRDNSLDRDWQPAGSAY